ncbi:MAG TPA: DUF998 domain-containing protein [Streptosporangiales bacterium]
MDSLTRRSAGPLSPVAARTTRRRLRVGAVCWLLTAHIVAVELVVASAWRAPYDFSVYYISDLAATTCEMTKYPDGVYRWVCSPLHPLMNASFIVVGVLVLTGLVLTHRFWPRGFLGTSGLAFVTIAGVGIIAFGFVPETVDNHLHVLIGLADFPAQGLGMLLLGLSVRRARPRVALYSVLCGAVNLVATALYFDGDDVSFGIGVVERIAVDPFLFWLVGIGVAMLAVTRRQPVDGPGR